MVPIGGGQGSDVGDSSMIRDKCNVVLNAG